MNERTRGKVAPKTLAISLFLLLTATLQHGQGVFLFNELHLSTLKVLLLEVVPTYTNEV